MKLQKKIECEAKLKVIDLEGLMKRIMTLGWICKGTDYEINELYSMKNGFTFRIRKIKGENNVLYTHKGENLPSSYKKKKEYEKELSQEQANKIIKHATYLGVYEKKRTIYKESKHCLVTLDEVASLGHYIEIEAPDDEKITEILLLLRLNPADHICESYFTLLQKKNEKNYNI